MPAAMAQQIIALFIEDQFAEKEASAAEIQKAQTAERHQELNPDSKQYRLDRIEIQKQNP